MRVTEVRSCATRCFDRAGLPGLKASILASRPATGSSSASELDDWEGSPPASANIEFTSGFVQRRGKSDNVSCDKLAMFSWLFSV
jgi:hypothetical protein